MVLSMTGYGRAGALLHGRDIKVELRSVNARFFEYSSRLPRSCAFLEDKLKKLVASKVSRGKVELSLSIQTVTAADTVVTVNWQLAEGYRAALNAMAERMDLKNDVSVGMLSRFRTAKQRLDDAKRDEKLLYVTAPGVFLAEPLDMVSVKLDALGISGSFTVQEAQSGCDETGATCTLILR